MCEALTPQLLDCGTPEVSENRDEVTGRKWWCLYISVCLSGCVVCVCGECVKWKRLDCIPKLRVSGKGEGTRKVH